MSAIVTAPTWHGVDPGRRPVVLGVVPDQPASVVTGAADLAADLGAALVCVWADGARVAVSGPWGPVPESDGRDDTPAGTIRTVPLDPDQADDRSAETPDALESRLTELLTGRVAAWALVEAVGEPARALDAVGELLDARVLAVGPRRSGIAGWMNRVVGGSVAGRLAHTQHRPVVVVPPDALDVG